MHRNLIFRFIVSFAILASILLLSQPAFSQEGKTGPTTGKAPSGKWFTLQSEHFCVHYNKGSEKLAERAARIAEDVHKRLAADIGWLPGARTHIVILDWMDSINGWASPLPRNTITIYPVGPGMEALELTYTDDWLRMVITHEYVHTLTLDMVSGLPAVFRKVFGRSIATVPNAFMPEWILEGYAVYEESKQTAGGRVKGPYFDMVLRAAVLEGRFNDISQAQSGLDTWPAATHYIYGAMFCKYLADRFGEGKLAEIYRRQSSGLSPFVPWAPGEFETVILTLCWLAADPVGESGYWLFGANSYKRLWHDWHLNLRMRYEKQKVQIGRDGVTESQQLTHTGYRTGCPKFSPDGAHIAYISRGSDRDTQLRIMDSGGKDDRLLCEGEILCFNWSPDGRKIVFAMLDWWRGVFLYSDLYVYELESGKVSRLTRGLRARAPAFSPDGKKILFAVNTGQGNSGLAVLDMDCEKDPVTYITDSADQSFYSGCAWSPDGKEIAYIRHAPGALQQIYVAEAVTDGRSQEFSPSWSYDGKYLLFSSSRTGVHNIFAYCLETEKTHRLTNVLGGAISPSLSPDGTTLAFAGYWANGWDIHSTEVEVQKAPAAQPAKHVLGEVKYELPRLALSKRSYSAFETLLPTAWTPFFFSTGEYGVMVAGHDVLERHFYTLEAGANCNNDYPVAGGTYTYAGLNYRGLPVDLNLRAFVRPVLFTELMTDLTGGYVDYWENRTLVNASFEARVWRSTSTSLRIASGYEFKQFERITSRLAGGIVPGTGTLRSAYISCLFDSTKFYNLGISAADGRTVRLSAKSAGPTLGSDYRIDSYTLRWSEFVSVPGAPHHVLLARACGGVSEGDVIDKRSFFQVGGLADFLSEYDQEWFALRGYESGEFLGTRAAVATLEYRFPLWLIESGPATRPTFFRKLSGYVFVDSGDAWTGQGYIRSFKTGAGFGLRLTGDLFYAKNDVLAWDVGFAHGFDKSGIDQVYFTLTYVW